MASSMIWVAFIVAVVAVSASTLTFVPTPPLSAGAFELYSNLPALTVDSPSMVTPTKTPLAQMSPEGADAIALQTGSGLLVKQSRESDTADGSKTTDIKPGLSMTKGQLEEVLGSALDVKFNLKVLADKAGEKPECDLRGNSCIGPEILGQIPVHLKVNHLTIGGVLISTMTSESTNLEQGPVNYGNIHV